MSALTTNAIGWIETGLLPDPVVRAGIRRLLEKKRREVRSGDVEYAASETNCFIQKMNDAPVALVPDLANQQHYEVPAEFFSEFTGERMKYSCCYWPRGVETLAQAELAALTATMERAEIGDGMRILDLGCGWGSFSLFAAERYPGSQVTAVSNSASQCAFIREKAERAGLSNIQVITRDMNDFEANGSYDRVVSVEMFEHMRNWRTLFDRIDRWLADDGRFFMHVFCHRSTPYEYEDKGPGDWMSRYFFSGGMMPSAELPLRFADRLCIDASWHWNGKHYARTLDAWLDQLDGRRDTILPILADCYGAEDATLWMQRWRIFLMACSELFAYDDGREWFVGHYRFRKPRA